MAQGVRTVRHEQCLPIGIDRGEHQVGGFVPGNQVYELARRSFQSEAIRQTRAQLPFERLVEFEPARFPCDSRRLGEAHAQGQPDDDEFPVHSGL